MNSEQLKQRTKIFAHRCIRPAASLPKMPPGEHVCRQIIRSSTSVPADYRAACRAQTKAGFVAKISIAPQEADETLFRPEFIAEEKMLSSRRAGELIKEADELTAVFTAARKSARSKTIENAKV